jgi:membrane-associated protease RseP (regulator of RpoE activity)
MKLVKLGLLTAATAVIGLGSAIAHPGHPPIPTPTISVAPSKQSVPFELFRGNRIVIPARVNGHETQVILDTGASMTTINRAYARSIGLPEGFKIQAKGAGGVVDAELVSGLTLDIGALRIDNASVGVMDLAPIERSLGRPINAIIGRDFFNSAVVSIDWAHKRLNVTTHEAFRPKATANAVELARKGPFNTISVSIAGAPPIDALLDLGNGGALGLPRTYWGSRPELSELRSAGATQGGVGGMHPARAAMVPQVRLGGTTFASVPAILSESGNDDDPTQMANVGIGLLKQFDIDLDLGRDRIYLAPRADAPPFDRDRAGVRFDLLNNRLKVAFVSPQGPAAAAGLKAGDEVVAVDGRRVTADYYRDADWIHGSVGKIVKLDRADGSHVAVKLQDYF